MSDQTADQLISIMQGSSESVRQEVVHLGEIARQLTRIADALEARNAIDGQMAEFAELLQQGAPRLAHEGHPDLAPDGQPWGKR